ncbi:MAG: ribosomal-processing cysteine protease Prp [Solobacterium sp.]|nr:ribosomal-processing cysteine protease Prp [Solobacterium sp.]
MIHIEVRKHGEAITGLSASGHAEAGNQGEDLICAAVSAILFGLGNAADEMSDLIGFEIAENQFSMYAENPDSTAETILQTGYYQLKTVEESYSDFVEIKTLEV